jgi:hypothetical protein
VKLCAELQRARHEHSLAIREQERLRAQLTRAFDGFETLQTHLHSLIIEALKLGLGELVGGSTNGSSTDVKATGDVNLCSPEVIAKIDAIIDTEMQTRVRNRPSSSHLFHARLLTSDKISSS